MQATTRRTRPNGHARTPWLVWLMAGILFIQDLLVMLISGDLRPLFVYMEAPLEPMLLYVGFRLAIFGVLVRRLGRRRSPMHWLSRALIGLFGLCAGVGMLAFFEADGSQPSAGMFETWALEATVVLHGWVSVATAGALAFGLLLSAARLWYACEHRWRSTQPIERERPAAAGSAATHGTAGAITLRSHGRADAPPPMPARPAR